MEKDPNKFYDAPSKDLEAFDNNKKDSLRHWLGKKTNLLTLAGIVTISSLLGGCGESGDLTKPEAPGEAYNSIEFEKNNPICISVTEMGEKKFIEKYSDYYSDPEFAFEALYTYERYHDGESIFINPDYVTYYNTAFEMGEEVENQYNLGFEPFNLNFDADLSAEGTAEIFNNYTVKLMDRCMNMIACNPGATDMIRDEFLSAYPDKDPYQNTKYLMKYAENLYDAMESVVNTHGDYCQYSTYAFKPDDAYQTQLDKVDYFDANKNAGFEQYARIGIDVTDYSKLDEDGLPLIKTDNTISEYISYRREVASINEDNSFNYSEKIYLGIHRK